eukprot:scaffold27425_cov69-Phaeocystis_antarctica.AAC.5
MVNHRGEILRRVPCQKPWRLTVSRGDCPSVAIERVKRHLPRLDTWEVAAHVLQIDSMPIPLSVVACTARSGLVDNGDPWVHANGKPTGGKCRKEGLVLHVESPTGGFGAQRFVLQRRCGPLALEWVPPARYFVHCGPEELHRDPRAGQPE